jgi:hypothetical protein
VHQPVAHRLGRLLAHAHTQRVAQMAHHFGNVHLPPTPLAPRPDRAQSLHNLSLVVHIGQCPHRSSQKPFADYYLHSAHNGNSEGAWGSLWIPPECESMKSVAINSPEFQAAIQRKSLIPPTPHPLYSRFVGDQNSVNMFRIIDMLNLPLVEMVNKSGQIHLEFAPF